MAMGTFKDLCFDAGNAAKLGEFWSTALGLTMHRRDDGHVLLTGPTKAHTIWINQVPEPKTVKHRVHVDVHGSSVEQLQSIGATVVDAESFCWVVMADPEGGEFCLFIREEPPAYRLYELAIDCADHESLSAWWATAIGGSRRVDEGGFSYVEDIPDAPFDNISFAPVDESKLTKNRVHIDVVGHVWALIDSGASLLRRRDDEIGWDVLADPEGNEFCVFAED